MSVFVPFTPAWWAAVSVIVLLLAVVIRFWPTLKSHLPFVSPRVSRELDRESVDLTAFIAKLDKLRAEAFVALKKAPAVAAVPASSALAAPPTAGSSASAGSAAPPGDSGTQPIAVTLQVTASDQVAASHADLDAQIAAGEAAKAKKLQIAEAEAALARLLAS